MIKLTKRQNEILELIKQHIEETGFPPTRAEIARTFGFRSPNAAEEHLRALQKKGAIEITPNTSRGIRIPDNSHRGLPLVGNVAAGHPILAQEHIENHISIDHNLFSPRADFLLRVRGMSMKDEGILDGDLLAVHRTPVAQNGQIVVARIDDEVTVKTFERYGSRVFLHPANDEFKTIEVNLEYESFAIEGLSVGVIRR